MSTESLGGGMTAEQETAFRAEVQRQAAADKETRKTCVHAGYSFKQHGRCCPACGAILTDFGD